MSSPTLQVRIDDRVRLMSALLSITDWPSQEQARKRHRAHVHARNTAKRVAHLSEQPAVETLQNLLNQGTPIEAIYTYALTLTWPDMGLKAPIHWSPLHWNEQLGDFFVKADLAGWWSEEKEVWQRAEQQIGGIVRQADLQGFFRPFVGNINEQLVLMPNISYPSDIEIGVRVDSELVCIVPPRIAWGDNEPWPFDEDQAHVFRSIVSEFGRLLMVAYLRQNAAAVAPVAAKPLPVSEKFRETHTTWSDQFTGLFVMGAVALFLEQMIGEKESKAYNLMENRLHGITIIPGVVSVLKRYLSEHEEGRYKEMADFLSNFPKHLRVAKRVVSL